jgi:hypothetical protein
VVEFQPFVYGLVDPIEPGHVRYVGMAPVRACRPQEHAKEARRANAQSTPKINWIRSIQREGRNPSMIELERFGVGASQQFVGLVEKLYIDALRKIGHRLTNVAEGGHGGEVGRRGKPGKPHTQETIEKIRAAHTGVVFTAERCANISAARKGIGHPHTQETRQKIGAKSKGRKASGETRKKQSEAHEGYVWSDEAKAKVSASLTGRVFSEEHRANLSAANARRSSDSWIRSADSIASQRQTMLNRTPEQVAVWAAKRAATIAAKKAKP